MRGCANGKFAESGKMATRLNVKRATSVGRFGTGNHVVPDLILVVQATSTRASATYAASASGSPNGIDVNGGAAGTDNSSFSLNTGGLIAVVVVISVVVILGGEITYQHGADDLILM